MIPEQHGFFYVITDDFVGSSHEKITLHKINDNLNPDLRVSKNREFFIMAPEEAYELLETISLSSGSQDKLKKVKVSTTSVTKPKKPPINFAKCGIPVGAELVFIEDDSIKVIVVGDRKVQHGNELTSLSADAGKLKAINP